MVMAKVLIKHQRGLLFIHTLKNVAQTSDKLTLHFLEDLIIYDKIKTVP